MSRVGKKPIVFQSSVTATLKDGVLKVVGPKGNLELPIHPKISLELNPGEILVDVAKKEDKKEKALWGLFRALIANMVNGVTTGFEKKLEVNGVGFKVNMAGNKLVMALGFSHPVEMEVPKELTVTVEKNLITISGIDKQLVGEFAAKVREKKKPEPYKGKGIKYIDETILRKAGKTVKAVGK